MKFDSQYQGNICHKLDYDQYYTPDSLAIHCVQMTERILGKDNITEYFEPSAGTGAFIRGIRRIDQRTPIVAVDIEPKGIGIAQGDFLSIPLRYKKGRCFIGNPPFGARLSLAQKFWKRCVAYGDYVAWILPISQFMSNASMYEFDLVYSERLGKVVFSGRKPVECCFNIYRRPAHGVNKRKSTDLKSVAFMRSDSNGYADFDYDFRMVCWGGRAGSLLKENEPDLAMVYKIKVKDPSIRGYVRSVLQNTDWKKERPSVSCKKVQKTVIVKVLKKAGIK